MELSKPLLRAFQPLIYSLPQPKRSYICAACLRQTPTLRPSNILRRQRLNITPKTRFQRRHQSNNPSQPADIDPAFRSIVDNPPTLIRSGNKHKPLGLALLASIPLIAFALGCWQVQRLGWKTSLIARFEDRLVRDPLPLPPVIDPNAVTDFDYRRVTATGRFQHDKECLIGPRIHDGQDGFLVITPLDRSETFPNESKDHNTTILVNRGWIPKSKAPPSTRPDSLTTTPVTISGLLRSPWQKNFFTPANNPTKGQWHFPDVAEMAAHTGSQAIWIEETMTPDLLVAYDREAKGVPIGRPAEVNLRNNHVQYIFTWFSLSAATAVMLWMVVKKPPGAGRGGGRVRRNAGW